jgi:hypothetical protein
MPRKVLNWLLSSRCSHQFSWPRRAADGSYYQACVLCGELYSYDWSSMRRTKAKRHGIISADTTPGRTNWQPRARRIATSTPAKYRTRSGDDWKLAVVENVSKTGVLLRGDLQLDRGDLLELIFAMPAEIAGAAAGEVSCAARVIRTQGTGENTSAALAIIDYVFVDAMRHDARSEHAAHGHRRGR